MKTNPRFYLLAFLMILVVLLLSQGTITSATKPLADIPFTEHIITNSFGDANSVYATDVDGDGDIDVIGAAYDADDVAWWKNDGNENFAAYTIADTFEGAWAVYAADVDDDTDMDVLGAGSDGVTWWENTDGSGTSWTGHPVDEFLVARDVHAADVDGDGDVDILGTGVQADNVAWWENTNGSGTAWTEHIITGTFDGAFSVYAIDMDGDDDVDVLGTALSANTVAWWENTDGSGTAWAVHIITNTLAGANSVYATDVDGDGDTDVLGAAWLSDDIVAWWENNGNQVFVEHIVSHTFDGAASIYATDVDGDGDVDILGAARYADEIAWWENDGSQTFTQHTVSNHFQHANCVYATDVDGDGDTDILGAAGDANTIAWWENTYTPPPILSIGDVSVTEGDSGVSTAVFSVTLSSVSTGTVTVEYATADGSATAPGDYTAIPSSTLSFPPGTSTGWITVSVQGDNLDEPDETFSVNLANPVNAVLEDAQGQATILDDDVPQVQFGSASYSVGEEETVATITVALDTPSWQTITVDYVAADGTAAAGEDYTAVSGTLIFDPDLVEQTFTVPILGDGRDEEDETITLTLSNPTHASLGQIDSATLTILDDDGPPSVRFSAVDYGVAEAAGSAPITVTLSHPYTLTVTADYSTLDGTATAGEDYTAVSGTLTFDIGATQQVFTVPVLNDSSIEANESLSLTLANPTNGTLRIPKSATLTIWDDDRAVEFDQATYTVAEKDAQATLTVTLNVASDLTVTVDYATSDGTATAGEDYGGVADTLIFTPGLVARSFSVPVIDDTAAEGDETITLTLSNPDNATLGALYAATLLILDNDCAIYLPVVMRRWPPIPQTPVLNPIFNPDGDGNYTVSWNSVEQAESYILQVATSADFGDATLAYQGPDTSYAVSGQTEGTYYYRVRASNSWGDSGWSNTQSVQVRPPDAPMLSPIDNPDGDGNYTVSWSLVDGAQTYALQEDDNAAFDSPETVHTGAGTSWNASGKAVGTYYYRVRASNAVGDSEWSNVQSVKVGPPDTPGLHPISNPDGDGNYTVSWNAAIGAQTYTLREDDNPNFSSPTIVYSGPYTSTSITRRAVGTYYYQVRAANGFGDSNWSQTESVVVTVAPPPCDVSCSTPSGYCTGSWSVSISCESGSYNQSGSCYNCGFGRCCDVTRTYNLSGNTYYMDVYYYDYAGFPHCRLSVDVWGGVFGDEIQHCQNY